MARPGTTCRLLLFQLLLKYHWDVMHWTWLFTYFSYAHEELTMSALCSANLLILKRCAAVSSMLIGPYFDPNYLDSYYSMAHSKCCLNLCNFILLNFLELVMFPNFQPLIAESILKSPNLCDMVFYCSGVL